MEKNRILYSECLRIYNIEETFITSLFESGLIHIYEQDNERFMEVAELENLEQFARWYYEMDINVAGIEALHHMLARVKEMQSEIEMLKSELKIYRTL